MCKRRIPLASWREKENMDIEYQGIVKVQC